MKARIDASGLLHLERAGEMKVQECPYSFDNGATRCGDWCPLFGEPQPPNYMVWAESTVSERKMISLELCRKNITVDKADFADERPKGEKNNGCRSNRRA